MRERRISDLLQSKGRFLRSVNLERDFHDSSAFSGYVVTDSAITSLRRLSDGLKPRSGARAWRVTGHYGSGKSSFALLLAHWLAGSESDLPPTIRKVTPSSGAVPRKFFPILVTCARQPLAMSIVQALRRVARDAYTSRKAKVPHGLNRLIGLDGTPSDDFALESLLALNSQLIADSKASGVLLILDELGKALEFAASHPERQDVFFLQRIAEAAARSGGEPLFVVSVLHQGFSAYADQLDQSAEREWEKIAGRFEEIVFEQPLHDVADLVASALNVAVTKIAQRDRDELNGSAAAAATLSWFGPSPGSAYTELASRLFPLHPTVLPVLVRVFRRFGQNERSLFSFLLSNEPFGLQAFAQQPLSTGAIFRLHDLYDYVRANFGYRLAVQTSRSHWSLISSVIDSFATDDDLDRRLLKTVGVLNLLDDDDLHISAALLECAVGDGSRSAAGQIHARLKTLRTTKRVLWDRGSARGLCLWPHTSVNLDKAYEDARRATAKSQRVAGIIKDDLDARPVVARRHYIETGTLRHWAVRYCTVAELATLLDEQDTEADGTIVVPLCETPHERRAALECVKHSQLRTRETLLLAIPQPLNSLAFLVQEFQRWDWISTHVLELNADRYGREEVARRKTVARLQLDRRLQSFVGFKRFSRDMSLDWYHKGEPAEIHDGRQLLEELSGIFDAVYGLSPKIHNELVNRRAVSSAAAAARMRLISQMLAHPEDEWLGMDPKKAPPEMSMFLSAVKAPGLHLRVENRWQLGTPTADADSQRVLPALSRIEQLLTEAPDRRIGVAAVFEELRRPPYGIRDGILPLLLTVFAVENAESLALYKDGTFLREITAEAMLLLTKAPDRFELQLCRIEGVRAELFDQLVSMLELDPPSERNVELLDVVQRLCVFVAQLPQYVLNTRKLPPIALAVRDAIMKSREPATLLFHDLPVACALKPIERDGRVADAAEFVRRLKAALTELRIAFVELEQRMRAQLRAAFDVPKIETDLRKVLSTRAQHVSVSVSEPKLRAFSLRIADAKLGDDGWLESIGSYLALKPPSKWHDAEEDAFDASLAEISARFTRVESLLFAQAGRRSGKAIRVAVTQSDGVERDRVVHVGALEEEQLLSLEAQFEQVISRNQRLGLAAASRVIWKALQNGQSNRE